MFCISDGISIEMIIALCASGLVTGLFLGVAGACYFASCGRKRDVLAVSQPQHVPRGKYAKAYALADLVIEDGMVMKDRTGIFDAVPHYHGAHG